MSAQPPLGDAAAAVCSVFDQVASFGPLQQYFYDPAVEEIWRVCRSAPADMTQSWAARRAATGLI